MSRPEWNLCELLSPPGDVRTKLKWADGKIVKNEVDLQASVTSCVSCLCGAWCICSVPPHKEAV